MPCQGNAMQKYIKIGGGARYYLGIGHVGQGQLPSLCVQTLNNSKRTPKNFDAAQ